MTPESSNWFQALERTRKATFGRISALLGATDITSSVWDELEADLVQGDLGIQTTLLIVEELKSKINKRGITNQKDFQNLLKDTLLDHLLSALPNPISFDKPTIILLVGTNGSGKTTTAAKLADYFLAKQKKVLIAAADTFRAAAIDQIKIWADRVGVPVIIGQPEADPGAVVYDAIQSMQSRNMDILIVDTAGRLHTRHNLMEELKKVYRVAEKSLNGAQLHAWLVLDATTGQNALAQAKAYRDSVHIDGVILAKMDSSARGGMAFAIRKELDLPILFVGLGENLSDLMEFNPNEFVEGLL